MKHLSRRLVPFSALVFSTALTLIAAYSKAQAQCAPPSMAVAATACSAGDACAVSVSLDTDGGAFAAAAATLTSSGAISCESCAAGAQAGGACNLNQQTCAWNVSDFSLRPFADGEVAVISITCDEVGTHTLDLVDASLGMTNGMPQASCGVGATLECSGCTNDAECADGNACTLNDACTAGVCTRDSFCGVPSSRGAEPVASDALFALRAAVGSVSCPLCECDVDAGGSITATDALTILQGSVGLGVSLDCFAPEV